MCWNIVCDINTVLLIILLRMTETILHIRFSGNFNMSKDGTLFVNLYSYFMLFMKNFANCRFKNLETIGCYSNLPIACPLLSSVRM